MSFKVDGNFFWDFTLADNIVYNLKILTRLYRIYNNPRTNEKEYLLKPIIITLVSIIEAVLHDFYQRMKGATSEGVVTVGDEIINAIRESKGIDRMSKYIDNARSHDLFELGKGPFYEKLEEVVKIRNRVHIQNEHQHFPPEEEKLFTESNKILAEKCLQVLIQSMSLRFPRPERLKPFSRELELPWVEY